MTGNSRHVDVAIIGGGLVGTSAAIALRDKGLSVTVLDRGFCGAGASGVNYGGVRRQGRPPEQLPLAQRAHRIWLDLHARIGIDGEFIRSGHCKLARNDEDMAALEAYADLVARYGLGLQLLGRDALQRRFGWIGGPVSGASFCPDDGHANPRLIASGFTAAARRRNVEILEETPVLDFVPDGGRFLLDLGVWGSLSARYLVNSAGAWADAFAHRAGEDIPLSRIYPSMIVTEPLPPLMTANIGMEGGGIYARQVSRGNCIVGGERGEPLADADFSRPTSDGVRRMLIRMTDYFPSLSHACAIRFWTGTEAALPDNNPVLGTSMTMPGLVHAFGFSGAGFQLAPAVGKVIAELILDGYTPTPVEAFSIDRFTKEGKTLVTARTDRGSGAVLQQEP